MLSSNDLCVGLHYLSAISSRLKAANEFMNPLMEPEFVLSRNYRINALTIMFKMFKLDWIQFEIRFVINTVLLFEKTLINGDRQSVNALTTYFLLERARQWFQKIMEPGNCMLCMYCILETETRGFGASTYFGSAWPADRCSITISQTAIVYRVPRSWFLIYDAVKSSQLWLNFMLINLRILLEPSLNLLKILQAIM